jgi:hypothetical protein
MICGDVELPSLEAYAVVSADCPHILFTENAIEIFIFRWNDSRSRLRGSVA